MNNSILYQVVLICTLISNLCGAPIDDQIISTTLSSTSLSSEKETLLADDNTLFEEIEEADTEGSGSTGIQTSDDSVSETTSRIVLEEDIAFLMPKTTVSTIVSSESTATVSTSNILATSTPVPSLPTTQDDLTPIIVNELPSVSFFTDGMPFVLICEAKNPESSEVFFTQPIKYSWNKNGRPFTELNDPAKQIYSESVNNGNILFVQPKSPQDEGTYQCVAENQFGKTFSKNAVVMELKRHGSPRALITEAKSPIAGEPIFSSVPENVPDFGLSREPKLVFYVYPSSQQETEEVEVINMLPENTLDIEENTAEIVSEETVSTDVLEDQEIIDALLSSKETAFQTESPEVVAEKEKTINDIKSLLPGLDLASLDLGSEVDSQEANEEITISEQLAEEDIETTESSIEDEILDLLNSDPVDGNEEVTTSVLPAQEDIEVTESSIEGEIIGLLDSDPAGGLDLRSD